MFNVSTNLCVPLFGDSAMVWEFSIYYKQKQTNYFPSLEKHLHNQLFIAFTTLKESSYDLTIVNDWNVMQESNQFDYFKLWALTYECDEKLLKKSLN
jgi:hypothetical protein